MDDLPSIASLTLSSNDVKSESFSFEKLLRMVQFPILRELDLTSFQCLKRCSKAVRKICEESGHLPDYIVESMSTCLMMCWVPVRIGGGRYIKNMHLSKIPTNACRVRIEKCSLNMENLSSFDDRLDGRKLVIDCLTITSDITCDVKELVQFLKNHKVERIEIGVGCFQRVHFDKIEDFLQHQSVRNLSGITVYLANEENPVCPQEMVALRHMDFRLYLQSISIDGIRNYVRTWPERRHPNTCVKSDSILDFEYDASPDAVVQRILEQVFGEFDDVRITYRKDDAENEQFLGIDVGQPEKSVKVAFVREFDAVIGVYIR